MTAFAKLFLPDESLMQQKSFSEKAQLPIALYGNLIFFCGFCTTFVAEILRGTYLTAAGSGTAVLCFLSALILIT